MTRHRGAQPPAKPKPPDQVRLALRSQPGGRRTERRYTHGTTRLIHFHGRRHPAEIAEPEINAPLNDLAVRGRASASTHTQALSGLLFRYRYVLKRQIRDLGDPIRARKTGRQPVPTPHHTSRSAPS